jgi:hypothetical protein
MESEHFVITGARRLNRRQCAILVHCMPRDDPLLHRGDCPRLFEVKWPWTGPLHYADVLGDCSPEMKAELNTLIEAYTK